jgi:hypothetical protein
VPTHEGAALRSELSGNYPTAFTKKAVHAFVGRVGANQYGVANWRFGSFTQFRQLLLPSVPVFFGRTIFASGNQGARFFPCFEVVLVLEVFLAVAFVTIILMLNYASGGTIISGSFSCATFG